jgi:hypothetical protein
MNNKKLSRQQARWALFLSCFNFQIIHKPESAMGKTNALSKRPDLKQGVENDNKDVMLLKPELFKIRAMKQGHILLEGEEATILSKIRKSKEYDKAVVKAVEEMKRSPVKVLRPEKWSEEQDLILFRGKVYVPNNI